MCTMNDESYCPICDEIVKVEVLFFPRKESKCGNIVRCKNCSLVFVCPMPDDQLISQVYEGLYENKPMNVKQKIDWASRCINEHIKKLKSLNCWPKYTFLDLAGGLGFHSKAAQLAGFNSTLVDMDKKSIEFAKDTLCLKQVNCSSIELFALKFKGNQYDVIFLHHVIEHIKNPRALLEAIYSLLSDNGVLILETPNNKSIEFLFKSNPRRFFMKYYKKNYKGVNFFSLLLKKTYAVRPPNHLYAFNIQNLKLLLKRYHLYLMETYFFTMGDPIYWPDNRNFKIPDAFNQLRQGNLKKFSLYISDSIFHPFRLFLQRKSKSAGLGIYAKRIKH